MCLALGLQFFKASACEKWQKDFGSGDLGVTARKAPMQGVRGAKAPPDASEVSFLKTIQSIRK